MTTREKRCRVAAAPTLQVRLLALLLGGLWATAAMHTHAGDLPLIDWQGRTMGSPYTVKLVGVNLSPDQVGGLKHEIESCLQEVNRQMSHYQPESELSRFNRAPAHTPFKVSPEFARVVRFSLDLSRRSQGAFDPTLSPVINLWGFGEKTDQRAVPPEAELKAALSQTGWRHLSVSPQDELTKDIPGVTLNLSGVAKGFGVDQMVAVLQRHGLTNCYVSIAGEVRALGHNSRGIPWQVGISAPVAHWTEDDPMAAVAALSDQAISTSGDYQQFFTDAQGRRLSHIIDPKTGWPVQHKVSGVSVVAPDNMTADALATTLFVLGVDEGLKFVEAWTNTAALFIVREGEGRFRPVATSRFSQLTGIALTQTEPKPAH